MERGLKDLKNTFNKTVLKNIQVSQTEKEKILVSLNQERKQKTPYKYYFSFVAAAVVVLLLFSPKLVDFMGKPQQHGYDPSIVQEEEPVDDQFKVPLDPAISVINEKTKSIYGYEVFYPSFADYTISAVTLMEGPGGHKRDISVEYSRNIGELVEESTEETNLELVYGRFDGKIDFRITYSNFSNQNQFKDNKLINGVPVWYSIVENTNGKYLLASFDFIDGGYLFEFFLSSEFTEETAFQILDTITKEVYEIKTALRSNPKSEMYQISVTEYATLEVYLKETYRHLQPNSEYCKTFANQTECVSHIAFASIGYINYFEEAIAKLGMSEEFDELQKIAFDLNMKFFDGEDISEFSNEFGKKFELIYNQIGY
ncbi:hypothetical protein [Fredinandcohnia sp. 179-A 10B2 NHS]|uniref:hypothetical protein n=1 Tax=Fredinandcohnia sp. 179-A 10B2 NHS TaxID=3235176 RepID=UPI00399F3E4D